MITFSISDKDSSAYKHTKMHTVKQILNPLNTIFELSTTFLTIPRGY